MTTYNIDIIIFKYNLKLISVGDGEIPNTIKVKTEFMKEYIYKYLSPQQQILFDNGFQDIGAVEIDREDRWGLDGVDIRFCNFFEFINENELSYIYIVRIYE